MTLWQHRSEIGPNQLFDQPFGYRGNVPEIPEHTIEEPLALLPLLVELERQFSIGGPNS